MGRLVPGMICIAFRSLIELKVTGEDLWIHDGYGLISKHYGNCPSRAIVDMFPNHPWNLWKFKKVPRGYWNSEKNQREFMDSLAKKLNLKEFDDWYQVSKDEIIEHGGGGLLKLKYDGDHVQMIKNIFQKDFQFLSYRFRTKKNHPETCHWDDIHIQRYFMDSLAASLKIRNLDEWYNISAKQLENFGGCSLLNMYGRSISTLLQSVYPEHAWEDRRWKVSSPSKTQLFIYKIISELFPKVIKPKF